MDLTVRLYSGWAWPLADRHKRSGDLHPPPLCCNLADIVHGSQTSQHISFHCVSTFGLPRSENQPSPRLCRIFANTGSTAPIRRL